MAGKKLLQKFLEKVKKNNFKNNNNEQKCLFFI